MLTKDKTRRTHLLVLIGMIFPALALACQTLVPGSAPVQELPAVTVEQPAPAASQIQTTNVQPQIISSDDEALVALYSNVNPSVVNITIFASQNDLQIPLSQGSGFVFDDQGHIVTNAHVVQDAEQIEVTFSDGRVKTAELVGQDLNSDLAVVRVTDLPEGVSSIPLADMQNLAVGQTVVAIGNPFGLEGTLTRGIISALGRSIPALTPFTIPESIQTDAAINPGNSGGPLLNLSGEVIGVNAQIETDGVSNSNLGVGFAIPVSIVKLVVPDLIANGKHAWAWLGVRGGSVTPSLVEAMNLPVDAGAYMAEVIAGGPSDTGGLRGASDTSVVNGRQVSTGGDVITGIDGQAVTTFEDLLIYIALHTSPGQEVNLTIVRDGQTQEVKVTLEERPTNLNQE
jgi:2-alkenal reductase